MPVHRYNLDVNVRVKPGWTPVGCPVLRVFIENEAGSYIKHHHDEETLAFLRTEQVGRPYPFPYGFVPGTRAPDGDCVDCFVVTDRVLHTGDLVDCEPFALMEQTEAGLVDHNILAVPAGEVMPGSGRPARRHSAGLSAEVFGRNRLGGAGTTRAAPFTLGLNAAPAYWRLASRLRPGHDAGEQPPTAPLSPPARSLPPG